MRLPAAFALFCLACLTAATPGADPLFDPLAGLSCLTPDALATACPPAAPDGPPVPVTHCGPEAAFRQENGTYVILNPPLAAAPYTTGQTLVEASILTGGEGKLGFYFLRPYWAKRDFGISVSGGPDGTILGDGRDVAHDYSAALVGKIGVTFPNTMSIAFSGFNLSLDSHLNRSFQSGMTAATLQASNTFNLTELTALEVPFSIQPPPVFQDWLPKDNACKLTVAVQYLQLTQDYHAALVAAMNSTNLNSHQDFTGFGVTVAAATQTRDWHGWSGYANLRGAVLIGTNNRNGNFSSTGLPAVSATETRTDFVPVGELEVGIEWEPKRLAYSPTQARPKTASDAVLAFRAGFVGQVIGDAGLPTVTHDQRAFDNGAVFLAGFGALIEYRH
jgi:hypothetical protein